MTSKEAKEMGYALVAASAFEVGLLKHGKGVRTWWSSRFGCKIPELDHPDVQKAIEINEATLRHLQ